jgi:MoaA/NifB/PqqE/SkfB family radical SAM enzyme
MAKILPARLSAATENVALGLVRNNVVRGSAVRLADRAIWEFLKHTNNPPGMKRDEWLTLRGLVYSFDRVLRRGQVSDQAMRRFVEFVRNRLGKDPVRSAFKEKYGDYPPGFLTISPSRVCNLNCTGCYAGTEKDPKTLDFATFDQILNEASELWRMCFVVISGGEPFMYKSDGRDLLDMVEAHPEMYFLVYTNGTQIDKEKAKRMGELGNITPAISVEGKVASTEKRRGEGVFGKVMDAFANLRTARVPFGLSMTATCYNCDELLSDEVVDFYFEEQGAMYGWIFQYMPIGKKYDLSLMVTPEQRLRLQRRIWQVIRERKVFLMDFWNSGTAVHGCLAGGRQGGYFYINWNGDVTPCVFVPYAACNIHEIYEQGGTLMELMEIDFFKEIRNWQRSYGYKTKPQETKNLILPCPHRDHFDFLLPLIEKHKPKPINQEAGRALGDPAYCQGLLRYDTECASLLDPVWRDEYLDGALKGGAKLRLQPVGQSRSDDPDANKS